MSFTEQEKLEEFHRLKEFLDSIEVAAEVIPKSENVEDVTLLVCLPDGSEIPEDHELTYEDLHMAAGYLLDLDDAEERLAKYMMFYSQISADMSSMTMAEVVLLLNEMNRTVRVGHYFLGQSEKNEPMMVHYRATVMCPGDESFDEGVVADTLLEMGVGYEAARQMIIQANEECKNRG